MSTDHPVEPTPEPELEPEDQSGLFRRTLRYHWVSLIFVWFAGSLIVAGLIALYVRPTFQALSVLRVEPPSPALFAVTTSNETFDGFLKTQVQLLTSPNVLTAAATTPKSANLKRVRESQDVVQELKKQIKARILPETTLIEVSMTSPDAYETAVLVNAVVESYLATNEEWANSMTRNQIVSLEGYLRNFQTQTDEIERQWKEIVANGDENVHIINDEIRARQNHGEYAQYSVTIDQFKKIRSQIFDLRLQLVQAKAWAKDLKDKAASKEAEHEAESLDKLVKRKFAADPEIIALAEQLRLTRIKLDEAKRLDNEGQDPATKKIEATYRALDQQYTQLWDNKSALIREQIELTKAVDLNDQPLRDAETRVRELQVKEASLKKMAGELDLNNRKPATDEFKIKLLLDRRATLKTMEEPVQRRLEQLRFEARSETRVRKVNEAMASNKPVEDPRPLLISIVPFVMLFATVGLFLAVEWRSTWMSRPRPSFVPTPVVVMPHPNDFEWTPEI